MRKQALLEREEMQRLMDEKDKKIETLEWEILKLKHEVQENKDKVKTAEKKLLT